MPFLSFEDNEPSLLVFSALASHPFRSINVGSRIPTCPACGKYGQKIGEIQDIDYVQFCGGQLPDREQQGLVDGGPGLRIRAKVASLLPSHFLHGRTEEHE